MCELQRNSDKSIKWKYSIFLYNCVVRLAEEPRQDLATLAEGRAVVLLHPSWGKHLGANRTTLAHYYCIIYVHCTVLLILNASLIDANKVNV